MVIIYSRSQIILDCGPIKAAAKTIAGIGSQHIGSKAAATGTRTKPTGKPAAVVQKNIKNSHAHNGAVTKPGKGNHNTRENPKRANAKPGGISSVGKHDHSPKEQRPRHIVTTSGNKA